MNNTFILLALLALPSLTFAGFNFQYDCNMASLPDNSGNVALAKNITDHSVMILQI